MTANGKVDWRSDEASDEEFEKGFSSFLSGVKLRRSIAYVENQREQLPPDEEAPWLLAREALYRNEDVRPLSSMLRGQRSIPAFIREMLADLLEPEIKASLILEEDGPKRTNPRDVDRLAFIRTQRTRGKMATRDRYLAAGIEVLELEASGTSREAAVTKVLEKLRGAIGSDDRGWIDHRVTEARDLKQDSPELYEFYRSTVRKL